ncbi:MAG: hypothetical protein RIQ60_2746 [Pseudomonadota bacterium]|jgi:sugar/nucleoside kinase (ribokinase family)
MAQLEILCAGMVVVDVLVTGLKGLPPPGETGLVGGVSLATGGDACNEAMSLAKLGHRVGLLGLVGDDAQGRFVREHCAQGGVDTTGLKVHASRPTSTGIVLIDANGERRFLAQPNASVSAFGPEHVDLDLIGPGLKVLSIGSLFCAPRFDREGLAPLLRQAKAVGAITVADLVMDERGYGLDGIRDALPDLDFIVPSELEGEVFMGSSDPAAIAAVCRRYGVRNVVLKRGGRGVVGLFEDGAVVECPAFNVPVVDTTGAGDNFVAGFIHGLVSGQSPAQALHTGSAVAALSIQAVGAGAGLKDGAQLQAFLGRLSSAQRGSPQR